MYVEIQTLNSTLFTDCLETLYYKIFAEGWSQSFDFSLW